MIPPLILRRARFATGAVVLSVASLLGWWAGGARRVANPEVRVIDVVDGDTILVELPDRRRETVRVLGVDTPETHHPTKGVECFGPEAAAYTTQRLEGRAVGLESDVERRDVYGRRLAHVRVEGASFGEELVRRGYARLLVIDPNRTHARELLDAELEARRARRGLWGACEAGD